MSLPEPSWDQALSLPWGWQAHQARCQQKGLWDGYRGAAGTSTSFVLGCELPFIDSGRAADIVELLSIQSLTESTERSLDQGGQR